MSGRHDHNVLGEKVWMKRPGKSSDNWHYACLLDAVPLLYCCACLYCTLTLPYYLAIQSLRCRFLHSHKFAPVKSLLKTLRGKLCPTYVSNTHFKRKANPTLQSTEYNIYRPLQFKSISPFKSFSTIKVVKEPKPRKDATYNFAKDHPKSHITI